MRTMIQRVSIRVAKSLVVLFIVLGLLSAASALWAFSKLPRTFGVPYSFVIIETYGPQDLNVPMAKIYLEPPSSEQDLGFEGASLKHTSKAVPHFQAAIPLPGVVVTGSGTIHFGRNRIDVSDGKIAINGRSIENHDSERILLGTSEFEVRDDFRKTGPLEIVLGRNGWYLESRVRIAR
jgi:hypothetical protein